MSSSSWDALGSTTRIRRIPLYSSHFDLHDHELAMGLVLARSRGGPLAVLRETKENPLWVSFTTQSGTPAGRYVPSTWHASDRLARGGAGWTRDGFFVVVRENSRVSIAGLSRELADFSLGCGLVGLVCVISSGCTTVCLTQDAFVLVNVKDGKRPEAVFRFKHFMKGRGMVVAMAAHHGAGRKKAGEEGDEVRVVCAMQDGSLIRFELGEGEVEAKETHRLQRSNDVVVKIAVSPGVGKFWATTTAKGVISVFEDATMEAALDLDTEAGVAPTQLAWCGEDAVAASFPENLGLLLIGPQGDWIKYQLASRVALFTEIDGVRVVSTQSHEFFQRVPPSVDAAFRIGSFAPVAMLLDASEQLGNGDTKANETFRALRLEKELYSAVLESIRAALCQFEVDEQQLLLRAAANGKAFLSDANERKSATKAFGKACVFLRVLNVVRHSAIGVPLTFAQFEDCGGPAALADMLSEYGQHLLAIRVLDSCRTYLRSDDAYERCKQRVLEHWAECAIKVQADSTDSILERVKKKLSRGFGDIALIAEQSARRDLAVRLVECEQNVGKKVERFVRFHEFERALRAAVDSKDQELIAFAMVAQNLPISDAVVKKTSVFVERMSDERKRFIRYVASTKSGSLPNTVPPFSVAEAIRQFIVLERGNETKALGMKREFKFSDLGYWVARVQAFIVLRDWEKLDRVAKERPTRVGIIVDACVRLGFAERASAFAKHYGADDEDKIDLLTSAGDWFGAVQILKSSEFAGNSEMCASQIRAKLLLTRNATGDSTLGEQVEKMLTTKD